MNLCTSYTLTTARCILGGTRAVWSYSCRKDDKGIEMPINTPRTAGYDAFISYSQAVSGELATALQAWLERFATPWYRPRSLRIFRDYTSLSASEDLWQTIEQALSSSSHFILLASPEAAKSVWVNREVEWWRTNRPASDVYIVLTSGELCWDIERNDWDRERTPSLPPAARGMFSHEPLWVDLSSVQTVKALDRSNPVLLNSVAQIAAPLRGVDKDTLVGEHITYYRRARRQRSGGVIALAIVTALAIVAAFIARIQADNATNQARIATARALAAAAEDDIGTNLGLAQVLAVEAYQLNPDAASRSALFQAVTATPALVRYLNADSTVSDLAGSGNGQAIVAGTQAGQVVRWTTDGFSKLVIAHLGATITSASVSYDGNTVAAADGAKAIVWTSQGGLRSIDIPRGQEADLTAVSPSGRFVLVYSYASGASLQVDSTVPGILSLLDMQTGQTVRTDVTDPWTYVTMPSDHQIVVLNTEPASGTGLWERRAVPTLALTGSGHDPFGFSDYAPTLSPDGDLMAYSNGDPMLPIWKTTNPTSDNPAFQAATAGPEPDAVAISPNDHEAATADNGSLYVAAITKSGTTAATQLGGNSAINPGMLAFVGDSSHLVSGSGSLVAFWNLNQLSRIGQQVGANVPSNCALCSGDWLTVSPDDKTAIMSYGATFAIQQLDPPFTERQLPISETSTYEGPVVWSPNGRRLFIPTSGGIEASSSPGLPPLSQWPDATSPNFMKAISTSSGGKYVITVGSTNVIEVRDATTGKVLKKILGPGGPNANDLGPNAGTAAINGDGTTVAVLTPDRSVDLISLQTGKVSPLRVPEALAVAFGGSYLAVLENGGGEERVERVELWNMQYHDWTQAAGNYISALAINGAGTTLAEYGLDDSILLYEPDGGATIGSFDVASPVVGDPPSLTFTDNGTTLLVALQGNGANFSGELERWDLSESAWMQTACSTAGVGLTSAEWREVVGTQAPATLACNGG
jgi:WD40 repeat protein